MATSMTYNTLLEDARRYIERGYTAATDPTVFDQLPRLINMAERGIAQQLKVQGFIEVATDTLVPGSDVYAKPDRWREWISINIGTSTVQYNIVHRISSGLLKQIFFDRPHGFVNGDIVVVSGVAVPQFNGSYPIVLTDQLSVSYVGPNSPVEDVASTGLATDALEKRAGVFPRAYEYIRTYAPDPRNRSQPLFYSDYDYYHVILGPCPDQTYPIEFNYYAMPVLLDVGNQTNWLTDLAPNMLLYRTLLETAPFLKNDERMQTWQGLYAESAQAITGQDMDKIMDRTSKRTKP